MKYILIAIFAPLFIGYFIQYIKALIINFKIWRKKRSASKDDLWMYQ